MKKKSTKESSPKICPLCRNLGSYFETLDTGRKRRVFCDHPLREDADLADLGRPLKHQLDFSKPRKGEIK